MEEAEKEVDEELVSVGGSKDKFDAELLRIKTKIDSLVELRKANAERFSVMNEQIGELRGMIMDTNRTLQGMEVRTAKAVNLVEAVQPDKLMVDVRKQDMKVDAIKANLEGNEAMIAAVMNEIKIIQNKIAFFKGIEQIMKISEQVKQDVNAMSKIKTDIDKHIGKIENIYVESQKKFSDFLELTNKYDQIRKEVKTLVDEVNNLHVKIIGHAEKKDIESLISKLNNFEKHYGNIVDLLVKKMTESVAEVNTRFKTLEDNMNKTFKAKTAQIDNMVDFFKDLDKRAPHLSKQLELIDKLAEDERLKIESGEIKIPQEESSKPKESFITKIMNKIHIHGAGGKESSQKEPKKDEVAAETKETKPDTS